MYALVPRKLLEEGWKVQEELGEFDARIHHTWKEVEALEERKAALSRAVNADAAYGTHVAKERREKLASLGERLEELRAQLRGLRRERKALTERLKRDYVVLLTGNLDLEPGESMRQALEG